MIRWATAVAALSVLFVQGPAHAGGSGPTDFERRALARAETPPLGLPPVPVPGANPITVEKISLGRKLFFDRRLSHNGTMSCAMCHVPEQGFTVNELATAVGMEGRTVRRNAPTIYNVAYATSLFHDGRETSLETQVLSPLVAHREMANPSLGYVVATIQSLPDYDGLFQKAFGRGPSVETLGQAIAAYERTVLSANSPFDRWRFGGEKNAVTEPAQRGFALFTGKAGCGACHLIEDSYALFTDQDFHDTGIGWHKTYMTSGETPVRIQLAPGVFTTVKSRDLASISEPQQKDLGRYEVTIDPADLFRYRTPNLRNVALTAPYMHDGSLLTLRQVVEFYNRGGLRHPNIDPLIQPLGLTDREIDDLTAFLHALTGDNVEELTADARSAPIGGRDIPPAKSSR
jgi:cytochrome c peroxidase